MKSFTQSVVNFLILGGLKSILLKLYLECFNVSCAGFGIKNVTRAVLLGQKFRE